MLFNDKYNKSEYSGIINVPVLNIYIVIVLWYEQQISIANMLLRLVLLE